MATIGTLFLFFGLLISFGGAIRNETIVSLDSQEGRSDTFIIARHRKLLHKGGVVEPTTIWDDKCNKEYIGISQSSTTPLPSGIPTYTVEITNKCSKGCAISDIHVSCGEFSSATVINPKVFKRLNYDDCIVNDNMPLQYGDIISFRYANTFSYSLSVKTLTCK